MTIHVRLYFGIATILSVVVLGAAVYGVVHSTPSGALFLIMAATIFVAMTIGIPLAALVITTFASRKRRLFYSSLFDGKDRLAFATLWTPKLSRQLRSTEYLLPVGFRNRMFSIPIFVAATSSGLQFIRSKGAQSFQIDWPDTADLSYTQSGRPELRFPTVVISILWLGGSIDMKFIVARADPAAARDIVREFQGQLASFNKRPTTNS
jgi:hypothetical protein